MSSFLEELLGRKKGANHVQDSSTAGGAADGHQQRRGAGVNPIGRVLGRKLDCKCDDPQPNPGNPSLACPDDGTSAPSQRRKDLKTLGRAVRKEAAKRMRKPLLDDDGLPMMFFNGSADGFKGTKISRWLWLSSDFNVALGYTIKGEDGKGEENPANVKCFFVDAADAKVVDAGRDDWNRIEADEESERTVESTDSLASDAFAEGHSAIIIRNVNDGKDERHRNPRQTVICVFDKRKDGAKNVVVKLADLTVMDDEGNPIALSKRFDMDNPDIRY